MVGSGRIYLAWKKDREIGAVWGTRVIAVIEKAQQRTGILILIILLTDWKKGGQIYGTTTNYTVPDI